MLSVNNIYLVYNQPVLNGISFSVAENEIIGIAGNSGAGKTSLLKIIAGLADATEGTIYLNNKRVVGPSMKLIPGHPDIQLVNQDFDLDSNVIEVFVLRLRKKLDPDGELKPIEPLRGRGYRFTMVVS